MKRKSDKRTKKYIPFYGSIPTPIVLFFVFVLSFYTYFVSKDFIFQAQATHSTCTMVVGFSQVGQDGGGWYTADNYGFERVVPNANWQLLWDGGHGVDRWKDPNTSGWNKWASNDVESPCTSMNRAPDRVLLSISGPHGTDVSLWASDIRATIETIRQKLEPDPTQIILQPVVGGPDDTTCTYSGTPVRASWQNAYIDQAVAEVVASDSALVAGLSPEVRTCSDYKDTLGHLTNSGGTAAGVTIGNYYLETQPTPTPDPTFPTNTPTPTITPTLTPIACAQPVILTKSDTRPTGSGKVSFTWEAVPGASQYRVQVQTGSNSWSTKQTSTSTSFSGSDRSNDPNWKVFVYTGTCTPRPGPAVVFDP